MSPGAHTDTADAAKVNATMAPLLAELGTPTATTMEAQNWIESVIFLANATSINDLNTTLAPDVNDTFYATSTFVSEQEPMVPAASDALMAYLYGSGAKSAVKWFIIL